MSHDPHQLQVIYVRNLICTLTLARRLEQDYYDQAFHHTEHGQVEIKTVKIVKTILLLKTSYSIGS